MSWIPWIMSMMWVGSHEWWAWYKLDPMNDEHDMSCIPWMMSMIWVGSHEWWAWYELEPMNDEHDKGMFDENTSNFQVQKSLTYEFSTLDETVKEEEGVKSSLCNLKLRNLNGLIFGQININSMATFLFDFK